MLRSLKDLESYAVHATDGDVGRVVNFLLDDERWIVRYLVVDAGGFLDRRRVLVSPIAFRGIDWATRRFDLGLTVDKVKHSPSIDVDKPVSRQHERDYLSYYGYSMYWGYPGIWGLGAYPNALNQPPTAAAPDDDSGDVHLRSADEVRGYHIQGTDDEIGHVEDFVVDDETWEVRYLVIDTRNWWFGKKVLVDPKWATSVSFADRKVHLGLTREAIKNSPEWDPSAPVNRAYETRLYDYYGRPAYWSGDLSGSSASAIAL